MHSGLPVRPATLICIKKRSHTRATHANRELRPASMARPRIASAIPQPSEGTMLQRTDAEDKHTRMSRKDYEKEMHRLQVQLCRLQSWVKQEGLRAIIVFEGRDAAGKGGTIKAITDRVSPRVFRVVALPAPSDREKTQMYIQRYLQHFPAAGEIIIF